MTSIRRKMVHLNMQRSLFAVSWTEFRKRHHLTTNSFFVACAILWSAFYGFLVLKLHEIQSLHGQSTTFFGFERFFKWEIANISHAMLRSALLLLIPCTECAIACDSSHVENVWLKILIIFFRCVLSLVIGILSLSYNISPCSQTYCFLYVYNKAF